MASFCVTLGLWGYGLLYLTYPVASCVIPDSIRHERQSGLCHADVGLPGLTFGDWSRPLLHGALGAVLLGVAPVVLRFVVRLDVRLMHALLSPTGDDRLRRTRALAVDDAAAALRRIERDLHDGTQAQLVALAMTLGLAQEELAAGSTQYAGSLVAAAHLDAKQAVVDLRDLARGIHPPVLDSGLAPALETLAARSAIPVQVQIDLPARPSPAIETIAYFSAAELLTNVAKHSRARSARLSLASARPGWLRLSVTDDGLGGAMAGGGLTGLTGLRGRAGTVDGTLTVDSPPGGPTTVTVELPVHA